VNLRPTMLDRVDWYAPLIETFTRDKLPWASTGARHGYPGFPPMDSYECLIAEYAAIGPRR
jgi:hypothetical protein